MTEMPAPVASKAPVGRSGPGGPSGVAVVPRDLTGSDSDVKSLHSGNRVSLIHDWSCIVTLFVVKHYHLGGSSCIPEPKGALVGAASETFLGRKAITSKFGWVRL